MPRHKKSLKEETVVNKNKKGVDALLSNEKDTHVILQLQLPQSRIDNVINSDKSKVKMEPSAYEPADFFKNDAMDISDDNGCKNGRFDLNSVGDTNKNGVNCYSMNGSGMMNNIVSNSFQSEISNNQFLNDTGLDTRLDEGGYSFGRDSDHQLNEFQKYSSVCYWCCHPFNNTPFGMPYNYDLANDKFMCYGNFCSVQCVSAHNFSVHSGSDKVWDVNNLINMMARKSGIDEAIRPAPSKFVLRLFGGPLSIEEFRKVHLTDDKSYVINVPPMIATNTNTEVLNTSYIHKNKM
jgi:hypothetical protein